ncbi:hypothetical protein D3C75_530650 [compost metagenome]
MGSKFALFASIEQQLIFLLNAPREEVLNLTKTERRRMAKALHRKRKALPVAVPDKTYIRLSCRPFSGPIVVKEFSYYTPFADIAHARALSEVYEESRKTGVYFQDIIVLEKDKVDHNDTDMLLKTVVLGSLRSDNISTKTRRY